MEITNTKRHKTITIYNWKRNGLIYHDFDNLYETYIKTMECTHCKKEFKNTKDRHLDHCHETGLLRKIVCQGCNVNDTYIRYPNGVPSKLELDKISYHKNKHKHEEKVREKRREKITCECGCVFRRDSKSKHEKTKKHTRLMEQLN